MCKPSHLRAKLWSSIMFTQFLIVQSRHEQFFLQRILYSNIDSCTVFYAYKHCDQIKTSHNNAPYSLSLSLFTGLSWSIILNLKDYSIILHTITTTVFTSITIWSVRFCQGPRGESALCLGVPDTTWLVFLWDSFGGGIVLRIDKMFSRIHDVLSVVV